jgi:hypothetical protein
MKYTLLEMTQDILSSMSSDEVNSISDTTESLQVANIIKQKYFDIISRVPLPEHSKLIQLDPSLTPAQPVLMYVPEHVAEVKWLKYFNSDHTTTAAPGYLYVTILPNDQFLDMVSSFNTGETNVETFTLTDSDARSFTFNYKNDRQPCYCTILNNYYVIFDSYDIIQDDTLQASKTQALGRIVPHWSNTDLFIPDLAEEQFQLLVNEAKSLAFFELKQQPHQLALQEAKRGWSNVQKNKAVTNRPTYFNELANFGRRSGVYYGTKGFGNAR